PFAVGDEVELTPDGQITGHGPRRTLLYRSDAYREKLIAANATQLLLVVATDPSSSDMLLSRALVAAEHQGLHTTIVLNKSDLTAALPAARKLLAPFIALGCRVVELSAKLDASPLLQLLAGECSVLVGQSGMGKSTLTNALVPGAAAPTRELSTALDSGKHTTTYARLYKLPNGGTLIDSPGLQEFGLKHLTPQEIEFGFTEFRPFLGQCRFRDCQHQAEPDCAIKAAVASGVIHPRRLDHFRQFISENRHGSH
ncbi:MAG: ribosome small subunit-dependent GTPase A, partial [Sulfuritalea sp.]|nr:ribosome small subunit-dependent GTPase A [Sulfuritalea sp.]